MGASQSTEQQEVWDDELSALEGFHILKLKPNSPAESSGLRPYFDIIIAVDGNNSFRTIQEFAQYLGGRLNQEVALTVLSFKTRSLRELKLIPRVGWSSNPSDGLLGCSVRFSSVERAQSSVWHILDIHPSSPAERAGLQAYSDYVIGCEYRNLESEEDFFDLILDHENKILSLLVYNAVWDNCRDVVIIPKSDWEGEGLLGCGVACGLLHRIPIDAELAKIPSQETVVENPIAAELASLDLNALPSVIPSEEVTPLIAPKNVAEPPISLNLNSVEETKQEAAVSSETPITQSINDSAKIDPTLSVENSDTQTEEMTTLA